MTPQNDSTRRKGDRASVSSFDESTVSPQPRGQTATALEAVLARLGDGTVASLYVREVRNLRTRSYQFRAPRTPVRVEVLHTLLGIELKIGRSRLLCPDRATARFLAVFAALGVEEVAVPYDITQVARLADLFESAIEQMMTTLEAETEAMSIRMKGRVRNLLIGLQRDEIGRAGAGPAIPEFDQNTRQRRRR
ncbi:MAG: hypothetical protein ABI882_03685 [Acidobacteriota bacterium]